MKYMMQSMFSCSYLKSVYLLWRGVCLGLWAIFYLLILAMMGLMALCSLAKD